jgi:flagellin-like hook-associated protein FlgL
MVSVLRLVQSFPALCGARSRKWQTASTGAAMSLRHLSNTRNRLDKFETHISTIKKINSPRDDAGSLGINGFWLDTFGNATSALSALDAAITDASRKLANLGSSANRIETHDILLCKQK